MKYIEEFRDEKKAQALVEKIKKAVVPGRVYRLMEFCGGHTHTIYRHGIHHLLPDNITLIHGPGCPVCVLPVSRLDYAIHLAQVPNVIFCSYGDMLRVPGTGQNSLLKAKACGADVRMVYSIMDALHIAKNNPTKEIIFFAIGFETTTPPTAVALKKALRENIKNFSIYCNHVLTPVAMAALLQFGQKKGGVLLDGFIGPAHVSVVIGTKAYEAVASQYKKPIVISGFEPLDVLHAIFLLVEWINKKSYGVENQFTRAVTPTGNEKAQALIDETLAIRDDFEWRGLGYIPKSALKIATHYRQFDAECLFPLTLPSSKEHKACACSDVILGIKKPTECTLFAKACTPENPLGSCMVSSEGACAAYYAYGRTQR